MPESLSISTQAPTQITGKWRMIARVAWLLILVLSVGKMILGLPLDYAQKNRVCEAAVEVCEQGDSLIPKQAQALESIGVSLGAYARIDLAWQVIVSLIWFGVGVFIYLLRPNDWLAWIASAMMILTISSGDELLIRTAYPTLGLAADLIFNLSSILLFLFIALFPSGRFSPRWMRWYWLGMILISLPPTDFWQLIPEAAEVIISVYWISFLILGSYSQIHRYRNVSSPVERQQTKWVVLGFAVFAGSLLVGFALTSMFPENSLLQILYQTFLFDLASLLIPLSIAFSMLRYRLWDVDLLIRRTLVYGSLTATLALVYFGSVLLLQRLSVSITRQQAPLVIVFSTLLIVALSGPLRRRIQNDIDRRFYRQKYNADQALAEFAAAARSEADLEALTTRLVTTVNQTVQPERVSLWLATPAQVTGSERQQSL